jgi:Cohesin loading factor
MGDSPIRDELAAISTLQKISNIAISRQDYGIFMLATLMEAMISILSGADGVEAANRALARVNPMQLGELQELAQLAVLRQIIDIMCSLMLGRSSDSEMKMKILHGMLDQNQRSAPWGENGVFELPVNPSRLGKPIEKLKFKWLTNQDVFVLGYFISGLCKFQRNVDEGGKAEKFLLEGLRSIDRELETLNSLLPKYCHRTYTIARSDERRSALLVFACRSKQQNHLETYFQMSCHALPYVSALCSD